MDTLDKMLDKVVNEGCILGFIMGNLEAIIG